MNAYALLKTTGLSILFTAASLYCYAGGSGTGGGTSIYCTAAGPAFPTNGWYFLDYVVAGNKLPTPYLHGGTIQSHIEKTIGIFAAGIEVLSIQHVYLLEGKTKPRPRK